MKTMKNKLMAMIVLFLAGATLITLGGYFLSIGTKYPGAVSIGAGAILIGLPFGELVKILILRSSPGIRRAHDIEQKDERNSTIRDKAGAQTYKAHYYFLLAAMLVTIIIDAEIFLTIMLAGIILLGAIVYAFYTYQYGKRF